MTFELGFEFAGIRKKTNSNTLINIFRYLFTCGILKSSYYINIPCLWNCTWLNFVPFFIVVKSQGRLINPGWISWRDTHHFIKLKNKILFLRNNRYLLILIFLHTKFTWDPNPGSHCCNCWYIGVTWYIDCCCLFYYRCRCCDMDRGRL